MPAIRKPITSNTMQDYSETGYDKKANTFDEAYAMGKARGELTVNPAPCPFCGHAGFGLHVAGGNLLDESREEHWIECDNCGARGPSCLVPDGINITQMCKMLVALWDNRK